MADDKKNDKRNYKEKETRKPGEGGPVMAFERPILEIEQKLREAEELAKGTQLDISSEVESWRAKLSQAIEEAYSDLSAWDRVGVARHQDRPVTSDYIAHVFEDFVELHGDKTFGVDAAMVTGLATLRGRRLMLIGHRKGRTTKERLRRNFGCAHPEGYRKALRKMRLAEKLSLPIVTLINTPGAYPGIGAEERGQAAAIAENILGMLQLRTPIVACVIGEGGSGGALGIGIGDRVLMMQYAYYSVISPEGCAAILWKDQERYKVEAARTLRYTAQDLTSLGIIDEIVPEVPGSAHVDHQGMARLVDEVLSRQLEELEALPAGSMAAHRLEKFRQMGAYVEPVD